ncbi:MAG TPA: penicillin acylase family protein, partial [Stellaceae bacterium]|nr:penicillin acylase family protein [Stellaceae bacterium]
VTPAELHDLYPGYPKDGFVTLAALREIYRRLPLGRLAALLPRASAQPNASNNWVLDGRHSATGKPILENDPHLSYSAPAIWYLAQVKAPGMNLAGAMIPGEPFVVVGHNAHIGWGFTETGGDVEDLFVEKIDPAHPDQYLTPRGWRRFATRRETIHVKGRPDIRLTVRSTRHGPVISDIDAGAKAATPAGDYALALEATFLQPGDKTAQAIWSIDRARNWDAFKAALRDFVAPQMNIVYADTGGTIGFIAPARIPIRKKGYGWLPEPGWTGAYDWIGFIPFDKLPQAKDPQDGHFISANNKIVPDAYPYFMTFDWAPPYRADRIAALLGERKVQTVQSTGAIAADTVSLMAKHLLPLLLRAPPGDRRSAMAEQMLRQWDGDMRPGAAPPLIFVAWLRETERELFEKRLGPAFADYGRHFHPRAVATVMAEDPHWCAVAADREKPDCASLTAQALAVALAAPAERFGGDMTGWRWGEAHQAYFRNYVIEHIPALDWFFRIMTPAGGGSYTVNAGDMDLGDARRPYRDVTGPGMRMILDFSDLSQSRFLMAPGVSEDPFSPHYRDLLADWKNFDWIVLDRAARVATLTLLPQQPKIIHNEAVKQ